MERRLQPRLVDSELVMICWEENATSLKQLGNVDDVSLGGVGLVVGQALPVGTPVQVSYGEGVLAGIVRHHTPRGDDHIVGIEFVGDSKDSVQHFHPDLLIQPF